MQRQLNTFLLGLRSFLIQHFVSEIRLIFMWLWWLVGWWVVGEATLSMCLFLSENNKLGQIQLNVGAEPADFGLNSLI